jgi:hypothetical protein
MWESKCAAASDIVVEAATYCRYKRKKKKPELLPGRLSNHRQWANSELIVDHES